MFGYYLLVLIGFIVLTERSQADVDCFAERNDPSRTIRCRSVPNCLTRPDIYDNHEHIIFDLENRYELIANEFFNCSFRRNLNMKFLNIKFVSEHAFQHAIVHENVVVKLQFKGPGLHLGKAMSNKELEVNADAFKSMRLNANSKLFVQVSDYETVYLSDYLTNSIEQEENTEVDVLVSNGYALIVKSALFNTDDESNKKFNFMFTNNLTYSFEAFDLDQVVFESQAFANLVVNPYSSCSVMLRSIGSIELSNDLFNTLLLGTHAQFNLLIQNVQHIVFGKNMFHSVQQHQSSVFYFQLDQILTSTSLADSNEDDYSDYYEDDDALQQQTTTEQADKSKPNWLCLPQGLFYNVQHHELAVTQIHFTNINHSISVSSDAFKEIKLSENSKFQILFQNLSENVVLNENAISLIKLSDGIFEVWIENHQLEPVAQSGSSRQTVKSFEMMENAVNKVYMTSRSFFRFGFTNSSAILMLNSNSFNAFHVDNYDILFKYDNKNSQNNNNNKASEYRTKIEFEIDESDYVLYDFKPVLEDDESERYDTFTINLPKLIELDGYKPLFDVFSDVNAVSNTQKSKSSQVENRKRLEEFCKFHKLKSFMHSVKANQAKQTDNMIYFAEAQRLVDADTEQTADSSQVECSSCLFIYLYADLHKRVDFMHLKEHLPKCFLNLHFKNNVNLHSLSNENERQKALAEIESSFNTYWTRMNCPLVSGGLQTPWTNELNELNSQGFIEANCQTTSDFYQKLKLMRQMNTKRFSSLVCSKPTSSNGTVVDRNKLILDRLREHEKADDEQVQRVQSANANGALVHSTMFTVLIMIVSIGFIVFLVLKYRRPEQPCVRLSFSPKSLCTRFNTVAKFNKIAKDDVDQHNSFDDLNAYEYDDEFEMISASNENAINRVEQGLNNNDDHDDQDDLQHIRNIRVTKADDWASSGQVVVLDGSSTSRLASIRQLARKQFKRLKSLRNAFIRNDQIKFSLINPSDDATASRSNRTYDSTKNRIIRRVDNSIDDNDADNVIKMVLEKANSVVSYDIKNSLVRPNLLNRDEIECDEHMVSPLTNLNSINLAANPIYQLEIVQERLANEKKDEDDVDEDEYIFDDEELKQVGN